MVNVGLTIEESGELVNNLGFMNAMMLGMARRYRADGSRDLKMHSLRLGAGARPTRKPVLSSFGTGARPVRFQRVGLEGKYRYSKVPLGPATIA
jgi:hypothetical protein